MFSWISTRIPANVSNTNCLVEYLLGFLLMFLILNVQLDIYKDPCHPRCKGLMLIETYTTLAPNEVIDRLPKFLNIDQEVRGHNYTQQYVILQVGGHLTGCRSSYSSQVILQVVGHLKGSRSSYRQQVILQVLGNFTDSQQFILQLVGHLTGSR